MKRPEQHPWLYAIAASLLMHGVFLFLFLRSSGSEAPVIQEEQEELIALMSLDLQPAPASRGRSTPSAPGIQYDKAFDLLDLAGTPNQLPGEQQYYPFYAVDTLPVPRAPYGSVIRFPDEARSAGITEAAVVFELLIDEKGFVNAARALTDSGYGFEQAVQDVIGSLKFSPALSGGKPVGVIMRERLLFRAQ